MKFKANEGVCGVCICGHSFDVDADGFVDIPAEIFALKDPDHALPLSVAFEEKKSDNLESVEKAPDEPKRRRK